MRKLTLTVAAVLVLSTSVLSSSCIGSFGLFNKVLSWNKQISGKFENEIVFLALWILPVYEVTLLADVVVINSIEFWSGTNPVTASTTKTVKGETGTYLVTNDANGYNVTNSATGETVRFDFNADERSWSLVTEDGRNIEFMTYVDDTHVRVPAGVDGTYTTVELSRDGLMAYRDMASQLQWAAR
ncbi:MAG: DUF3332 domain-containing protein [Muribaculaceae bacterium]|nr:DUF3332 domain-containing protein [Muribaculaceae bacterium]